MATPTAARRSRVPLPWNAELLVYLVVQVVIALMCLVYDSVNSEDFFEVTKWTTAGYLISRGIAKARHTQNEQ
jgi:hypothetical protein